MDWNRIKADYVAGGTSYRKLAAKYGVSFTTLTRTAQKENWIGLRQQAEDKAETKIIDVVSNQKVKIDDKYFKLVDKLLEKTELVIDTLDEWSIYSLKEIATTLKYLKECKGVKSDIDLREQEARIRNLEKQAEAEDKDTSINVVIETKAEEYSI